jgi:hypothetical protein
MAFNSSGVSVVPNRLRPGIAANGFPDNKLIVEDIPVHAANPPTKPILS